MSYVPVEKDVLYLYQIFTMEEVPSANTAAVEKITRGRDLGNYLLRDLLIQGVIVDLSVCVIAGKEKK